MNVEKASKIGFCFGVRRALDILEKVARDQTGIETLGEVVHNRQVLQNLSAKGVRVAHSIDEIQGRTVVTGAHGVTPQTIVELRSREIAIVDTTCPFVQRAQIAARRLSEAGFFVIVFGDANHPEIKGVLGCTGGNGIAALDSSSLPGQKISRRVGVLSQTTQIPARFRDFATAVLEYACTRDSEIRIIDTICHDIRERQAATLALAKNVDLMLVVGGRNSANTNHLADVSAAMVRTMKIETADEVGPEQLKNCRTVGIAAGASTASETIDEIAAKLKSVSTD